MKKYLVVPAVLAGCMASPVADPLDDPNLPIIRDYRAPGDQCKFVGESAVTVDYLDDAADLVACPSDYEGLGVFIFETGAIEVGSYNTWTLYSVPIR
jgi:hypothetical protein